MARRMRGLVLQTTVYLIGLCMTQPYGMLRKGLKEREKMPRKIEDIKTAADLFWDKAYKLALEGDYCYLVSAMDQCNRVDQQLIWDRQKKKQKELYERME